MLRLAPVQLSPVSPDDKKTFDHLGQIVVLKIKPHLSTRPLSSPDTGLLQVGAGVLGPRPLVLRLHTALGSEIVQNFTKYKVSKYLLHPRVLVLFSFSLQQVVVGV